MNTLNSDIQDIIYKFKHNLEYRQVLNEFNDMWSFLKYELGYTNLNDYEDGAITRFRLYEAHYNGYLARILQDMY